MRLPKALENYAVITIPDGTARHFSDFWEVERSPQRLLNALENERGFTAWYLCLRGLLQSSSAVRQGYGGPGEKLIHLRLQDCTRYDCHFKRIGLSTFRFAQNNHLTNQIAQL